MEPARDGLLDQKPRDPKEPILNQSLAGQIGVQGLLIAVATMAAFYLGLSRGGSRHGHAPWPLPPSPWPACSTASTAGAEESVFRLGLTTNRYSLMAFAAGVLLLAAVLFLPFLRSLFLVVPLTLAQTGWIVLLAFLPTALIQLFKLLRDALKK